jgi:hypothetical protein
MHYKQAPIYKYGITLVAIYLFIKHQHIMPNDKILKNTIAIILVMIIMDYILIHNHPIPLETGYKIKKKQKQKIIEQSDEYIEEQPNNLRNSYIHPEPEFEMDGLLN